MPAIKLSNEVASKSKEQFPSFTVEFDREGVDIPASVTFRNVILLDDDEYKAYNSAANEVRKRLSDQFEEAKKASESGDDTALDALINSNPNDVIVDVLRGQMSVLAEDPEVARRELDKLQRHEVLALHAIIVKDVASGE